MTDIEDQIDARIETIRRTESLAELRDLFGSDSIHEAYFEAKRTWKELVGKRQDRIVRKRQDGRRSDDGLPGETVVVDGHAFHVHGITHAGTDAERAYLREHVAQLLDRGVSIYCEQGIRPLYFGDFPEVCAMDDYRWALNECASLDVESHLGPLPEIGIDALLEDVAGVTARFREVTYTLIESGTAVYGDRFENALGDVAAAFLTGHAEYGTGRDYESFALSREASRNPDRLGALQRYYERTFLPQPLEREWLRLHDPELEIVTHARNERMADYAVYHNDTVDEVHLIVGAAHLPGVIYYLDRFGEGRRLPESLELM